LAHPTPVRPPPSPSEASIYYPFTSDDSDADDESSSDESMDQGGSIGTPAAPFIPRDAPVVPKADPDPPHSLSPPPAPSPDPEPAPRPPFPIGIGARLPRRIRTKPREWWKLSAAQLDSDIDDDIDQTIKDLSQYFIMKSHLEFNVNAQFIK